ncbi:potassium channel family protein [Halosegnis sp.]|uniref:potassium channel family protein n=1 Tax=Halosegnis sp. TaxID=2864959 RepID=UPI0035D40852
MSDDLRVAVIGSGRVGLQTARLLDDRGHDVVIIERSPERALAPLDEYVATVIEGDATRPSILRQIGLDRTDAVAAMTDTMATNLAVAMLTDRLAPGVRTVVRAPPDDRDEYVEYADTVVHPEVAGARAVTNSVVGGGVRTLEELPGELQLLELTVTERAPVAGKPLSAVALPHGSLVVSGAAGHHIADSDTELAAGHTYLVAVEPDVVDEVTRLFRG